MTSVEIDLNEPDPIEALNRAYEELAANIATAFEPIAEALKDICEKVVSFVKSIQWKAAVKALAYPPNTKLVRLALYAKESRTQKKNIHRILKILSK